MTDTIIAPPVDPRLARYPHCLIPRALAQAAELVRGLRYSTAAAAREVAHREEFLGHDDGELLLLLDPPLLAAALREYLQCPPR